MKRLDKKAAQSPKKATLSGRIRSIQNVCGYCLIEFRDDSNVRAPLGTIEKLLSLLSLSEVSYSTVLLGREIFYTVDEEGILEEIKGRAKLVANTTKRQQFHYLVEIDGKVLSEVFDTIEEVTEYLKVIAKDGSTEDDLLFNNIKVLRVQIHAVSNITVETKLSMGKWIGNKLWKKH